VDIVEGLASQGPATGATYEAVRMVEVAHGLTGLACARYLLSTCVTNTCKQYKHIRERKDIFVYLKLLV
jgi:hypothetical protein